MAESIRVESSYKNPTSQTVEHPSEGQIKTMRIAEKWSKTQPEVRRPPPRLGEDG